MSLKLGKSQPENYVLFAPGKHAGYRRVNRLVRDFRHNVLVKQLRYVVLVGHTVRYILVAIVRKENMSEYLIAHTNPDGKTGVAQTTIETISETVAREEFQKANPERKIICVGIRGKGEIVGFYGS